MFLKAPLDSFRTLVPFDRVLLLLARYAHLIFRDLEEFALHILDENAGRQLGIHMFIGARLQPHPR